MVYTFLNICALAAFIFLTFYVDRKSKADSKQTNSFAVPLLLVSVEAFLFCLIMIFDQIWLEALTKQLMRIIFVVDAVFMVSFSFAFLGLMADIKKFYFRILRLALYVFAGIIVYTKFKSIDVSASDGIIIGAEYLFKGAASQFFPWTWWTLYNAIYKVLVPVVCYLFLMLLYERKGNQLQKYQGIIIAEGIILMWILSAFVTYISSFVPEFAMLYLYEYVFMFVMVVLALKTIMVPSGKGIVVSILKFIVSYMFPAAAVAAFVYFFQPISGESKIFFIIILVLISVVAVLFSLKSADVMSKSSRIYTADYATKLERDLASIDYSGDMDKVAERMNEIVKQNIESSSMTVYINDGKGTFEIAYSSGGMSKKIPANTAMFDVLLNINKSVVVHSQIDVEHDISAIDINLKEFFQDTKSDALFILNEGHNILGLITLGKKISGDHYKNYDYNVFTSLYSYFFVFGYYMRNISNKEIIGTVNREIRMSSQIITSIQENIDHVKNPKIEAGYLMVPSHNIGGEFIDMIRLTDTRHLFVVGDLSGKGIAASMNMVILKSIIRTYLAETHDFKELVVKINTFIRDSLRKGTIFAGLFALIDFETDTMYYINCGIPALMMYTQVYNNVIEIQGSGNVLGFVKDISPYISVKTTKLNRGDIILACTDGLIQSHSLRGEQFGKERVQQAILDNSTYPAQRMVQFTFDGLIKFISKEMEDDVSILVLKYESTIEYADKPVSGEGEEVAAENEEESAETEESESPVESETAASEGLEGAALATGLAEGVNEEKSPSDENESVIKSDTEADIAEAREEAGDLDEKAESSEKENPVASESKAVFDDPDLPEGFEMPDLSDLDEMMKMAGL
ncbi:MAG: serine/threonine-protein phosphatase [Treponema sp.]|nr:serine/threonine-protein phosphatase [Treponema sp.]